MPLNGMSSVILSRLAVTDLIGIAEYSIETFGIEQARAYHDGLDSCFRSRAENPLIGRGAVDLAEGLRRYG